MRVRPALEDPALMVAAPVTTAGALAPVRLMAGIGGGVAGGGRGIEGLLP